jgi:hypothetical protein
MAGVAADDCSSLSLSWTGSLDSEIFVSSMPTSLSGVLCSTLASALNFANDTCTDRQSPTIDFAWLLVRCFGDNALAHEVLQSFCEQGNQHIIALRAISNSAMEIDTKNKEILFHAVIPT